MVPLFSLVEQYFRAFLLVKKYSPHFYPFSNVFPRFLLAKPRAHAQCTWSAASRLHDLGRHGGVKAGPLAGVLKGGDRDLLLRAGGDGLHPAHAQSSVTL
jgi:hypothetical protein